MVDVESFGEQEMLGRDHVVVVIARKMRVHAVAGLGGPSVANAIGQNDVVLCGIEQLSRPEQHARKLRSKELRPSATRAVQNEHRIRYTTAGIALRLAERAIVKAQLRERFS